MMSHSDYQRMIDRGRKAGLGTRELYSALGARRPEAGDQQDGNGYVPGFGRNGQHVYRPPVGRTIS